MLDLVITRTDGAQMRPPTATVEGLRLGTGRHGFSMLNCFLPMGLGEAFDFYAGARLADVRVVGAGGETVWRGRLEDAAIVKGGVRLGALGYARALGDLFYTALWSNSGSAGWRPVVEAEFSLARETRYDMDNNNRVFIAIKQGSDSATGARGGMVWELPDKSVRGAVTVTFDYEVVTTTGSSWTFVLSGFDDSWADSSVTVASTSTTASGSFSHTFGAGVQKVALFYSYGSAGPITYAGENGATFAKATNLRITSSGGTIVASEIAEELAAVVAGVNGSQLVAGAERMVASTVDLRQEVYEDARPEDILDRIAAPENYWWGVWDDQRLFFEPRVSGTAREFVVDVVEMSLEGSLEPMFNRAYANYAEAGGRKLRTATATEANSVGTFGLVRETRVAVETTSTTEAEGWRDAALRDSAEYALRADVVFERVYGKSGVQVPLWSLRAGDVLSLRNLPPGLGTDVDNVRTFRVATTLYEAERDVLTVEPDVPTPTLVTLLARRNLG